MFPLALRAASKAPSLLLLLLGAQLMVVSMDSHPEVLSYVGLAAGVWMLAAASVFAWLRKRDKETPEGVFVWFVRFFNGASAASSTALLLWLDSGKIVFAPVLASSVMNILLTLCPAAFWNARD